MRKYIFVGFFCQFLTVDFLSQNPVPRFKDGLKLYLNSDSSHYLRATLALQTWIRFNENNPGTLINNYAEKHTIDFSIRRLRFQLFGPVADRLFFYVQFGQNNFNYTSTRKTGAFFHDAVTEYEVIRKNLSLGAGLAGWGGPGRYSSPAIASTLMADAPLFQQTTNDVTDQFLRKLGVYAKGKLASLDYRITIAKPMLIQNSANFKPADTALSIASSFSPEPAKLQYNGYFQWQFLEQESNLTPYIQGNYLGKKRILNVGAGFVYQQDAMRSLNSNGIKEYHAVNLWAVDFFYDSWINKDKGNAITVYAGYFNFDWGAKYLRNLGVNNMANGMSLISGTFNGSGNAFPMYGTGHVLYFQCGYKFRNGLLGTRGTLQPYLGIMDANYAALKSSMMLAEAGVNWLISNGSKMSLNYQSRPVFKYDNNGNIDEIKSARRGSIVLQFQLSL